MDDHPHGDIPIPNPEPPLEVTVRQVVAAVENLRRRLSAGALQVEARSRGSHGLDLHDLPRANFERLAAGGAICRKKQLPGMTDFYDSAEIKLAGFRAYLYSRHYRITEEAPTEEPAA